MPFRVQLVYLTRPKCIGKTPLEENSLERLIYIFFYRFAKAFFSACTASWLGFQSTCCRLSFSFSFNLLAVLVSRTLSIRLCTIKNSFWCLLLCGFLLWLWPISHSLASLTSTWKAGEIRQVFCHATRSLSAVTLTFENRNHKQNRNRIRIRVRELRMKLWSLKSCCLVDQPRRTKRDRRAS